MLYFSTMWSVLLIQVFLISCVFSKKDSKPVFLKSKVNYTSKIGQTVRLKCWLSNSSTKATIKWTKDGVNVGKDSAAKGHYQAIKRKMGGLLRIKNTEKKDAGEYVCEAVNKYGSASRKLNLTVKGENKNTGVAGKGKPWFIKPPVTPTQFLAWPASSDIKFKCGADGERPLSYRWYKNRKSVIYRRLDPKMNTTRWYLRIKTAVPSDNGLYTCVVSNRLGNISKSIKFTVLEKGRTRPILSIGYPKNKTVKSGSNVTFECRELVSSVLTDYRWLKWNKLPINYPRLQLNDSIPASNSSDYRLINPLHYQSFKVRDINDQQLYGGRVHLQNVSKKDAGLYTCLVSNHIGRASRSAFLIINDKDHTEPAIVPPTYPTEIEKFPKSKTGGMEQSSIIAILMLCIVIVLTLISVAVFVICYKKKMSKKMEGNAVYCRRGERESINDQSSNGVFDNDMASKQDIVKLYGKRHGRLESNSSTSSTMPLLFSRQNSIRSRLPSNGGGKLDSDICEGEFELPFDEEWEIDERQLSIKEQLGEGAFGLVMKAEAFDLPGYPRCHTVAVKMLKPDATELELADLVSEIKTMKRIGSHKNIINLIGCCTQNGFGFPFVIVEFAPHGNLRQFLRSRRPPVHNARSTARSTSDDTPQTASITMRDFISFAFQICRGMQHLAAKKCIHRDLAARNVLVGEDYVMKIADFGLARHTRDMDYYRKTTDGRLPVKWLAIEALFDRVYTMQSDVWAFGILLWEIFTLGGSPYPGIPVEKLFELLKSGYRMEKPQRCPLQVYEIMLKTWSENSSYRPSFSELEQELEKMLSNLTNQEYVDVLANSLPNIAESSESDSGSSNGENNTEVISMSKDAPV